MKALKWFLPIWRANKWRMTAIVTLGMASAVFSNMAPLFIRSIIDGLRKDISYHLIGKYILLIIGLGLARYAVNYFAQLNRVWMNQHIEMTVRSRVFRHLLHMDRVFFHRFTQGDLLTRLTDDVNEKIAWFGCSGVFRFIQALWTLAAAVSFMLYLNPVMTFWAMLPMPFLFLAYVTMGRKMDKLYEAVQNSITALYETLDACFSAIRLVKANGKERCQSETFVKATERQKKAEIDSVVLQAFFSSIFNYVGYLCLFVVFLTGGKMVIQGTLSLGELVAFMFYVNMIIGPLSDISYFFISLKRAEVSIGRMEDILKSRSAVQDPRNPRQMPRTVKELSFEDVSFSPGPKAGLILKHVTFSAKAGHRVAVVGKIGSGKSILLSLIPRLIEPEGGRISVNGEDIREFSLAELRSRIGYVPQEAVIFSATIRQNITLGRPVSDEEFARAIETAQFAGEIPQFEKGLETVCGPRGVTLSGGQKQRLAIARALLSRPDMLLLDDCTSAMDAQTEEQLWNGLYKSMPDTLCLVSTHRIKTIETSPLILTLESGALAEAGTHNELMSQNGLYRSIYERQKLADEVHQRSSSGERPA